MNVAQLLTELDKLPLSAEVRINSAYNDVYEDEGILIVNSNDVGTLVMINGEATK